MNSAQRSSSPRPSRQPWFGIACAVVIVAVVLGGSFALKAVGDSRSDSSASGSRGAAGSEPNHPLIITLQNSSSVTIAVDVTNVSRGDWGYPAPDSAAPNGLRGAWIDPGQNASVRLARDSRTTQHAPFNVSTTPSAGSSTGRTITFYSQLFYVGAEGGGNFLYWSWPTPQEESVVGVSCSPAWSGPAGSYVLRDGRTGSITATANCLWNSDNEIVTTITFTDTKS